MAKNKNTTKFRKPSTAEADSMAELRDVQNLDSQNGTAPESVVRQPGEAWESFSHRLQDAYKASKKAERAERKAAGLAITGELPDIVKAKIGEAVAEILAKSPGRVVRAMTVQVRTPKGATEAQIIVKTLAVRKPRD